MNTGFCGISLDSLCLLTSWDYATIIYCLVAVLTFIPVFVAIIGRVDLHEGGKSFVDCPHFSKEEREQLAQHYTRIHGTLVFWKNQAEKYHRFHYYALIWSIPSAILIPIIAQRINDSDGSKLFITVVSTFTAILIGFHKGMKVEENYKGYRIGESEFYDNYRRLLDRPESFGATRKEQIDGYFIAVEKLRRFARNTETNNIPSISDVKQK